MNIWKNIDYTDKNKSEILWEIRENLLISRGNIDDFKFIFPEWKERVNHVTGALTCCIVALHNSIEEIKQHEIKEADAKFGKSIYFSSRGLGRDNCPCFVCGKTDGYLHNISGFVQSKEDGQEILNWLDGLAFLDYRDYEPKRIQLKIGACDKHLENLKELDKKTFKNNGRIRECDIKEFRKI